MESRIPNNLNLSFDGIYSESLLINLDMNGYFVSSGSACTSGSLDPSHVLLAMGKDKSLAKGSLRITFGIDNTLEETKNLANKIVEIVKRLRKL